MTDQVGALTSVSLFCTPERFAALRAFYVETVGLEPSSDRPQRVAFDWSSGPMRVRLIISPHDGVDGMTGDPYRMMINFQVDDIAAVTKRLKAAGIEFIREPSAGGGTSMVATFEDPDGNIVQLLQP